MKALEFLGDLEHEDVRGKTHNQLGSLHMEALEFEQAIEHLRSASKVAPENPKVWFNLAQCSRAAGDRMEALRYFDIALSIDPAYDLARQWREITAKEDS
jgi:tetratricopeptide (TPR) repeat protein